MDFQNVLILSSYCHYFVMLFSFPFIKSIWNYEHVCCMECKLFLILTYLDCSESFVLKGVNRIANYLKNDCTNFHYL